MCVGSAAKRPQTGCWSCIFSVSLSLALNLNLYFALAVARPLVDFFSGRQVRGALELFDFDDSSADTIRGFLLQCAAHPKFLVPPAPHSKGGEGRKFLVFLFGLHPSLVDGLHRTIKNQLPLANLKVQRFYGDLYLRAWKSVAATGAGDGAKKAKPSVYRRAVEACIQVEGGTFFLPRARALL